ncbi:MAG TPA: hypothetical protein V6C78_00790 [Crinalium sp.]|jgi:hypothetical protein
MADDTPILTAKTILEFTNALNRRYSLDLPTVFPTNTFLWILWNTILQNVQVKTNDESTSYTLEGRLTVPPFKTPATVQIVVADLPTESE